MRRLWKGDKVEVKAGAHRSRRGADGEEKKSIGEVLRVDYDKSQVYISGINVRRVATRRSPEHPQGGFIEKECPIHISNVKVVEPSAEHAKDLERRA
jgi:large subunit ribosomal protein L24